MIKRRFFKQEHGDRDDASDSSSSSSDSELEAEATEATDAEEDHVPEDRKYHQSSSSSSGYKSEDSSGNEVDVDSSGLHTDDEDIGNDEQPFIKRRSSSKRAEIVDIPSNIVMEKDSVLADDIGCILISKSVFKCRLCPRIVCLSEETLMAHLKSKRHARSEKLHSEGRLKLMLNSDGEIEGDGETHAERHARVVSAMQNSDNSTKKNKGRQRQRNRLKKTNGKDSKLDKAGQSTKVPARKRHKSEK